MSLFTAKVDDKGFLYDDGSKIRVEQMIRQQAKKSGAMIHWGDGTREWWLREPLHPYQWGYNGNRVRGTITHIIVDSHEEKTETVDPIWIDPCAEN